MSNSKGMGKEDVVYIYYGELSAIKKKKHREADVSSQPLD